MFVSSSRAAFERTLQVHVSRDLPDLARQSLARAARATVQRVEAEQSGRSGGITPNYLAVVDGVRGGAFDNVRPDGVIALDWNYMAEAVIRTVEYLRLHGPEWEGGWKRAIMVEVDGVMVAPDAPIAKTAKVAYVGPAVPYARRLEIGLDAKGDAFAVQVPMHFVESAAQHLARQLRGVAEVKFIPYVSFAGANTRMTRRDLRDSRVPAIRLIEVAA